MNRFLLISQNGSIEYTKYYVAHWCSLAAVKIGKFSQPAIFPEAAAAARQLVDFLTITTELESPLSFDIPSPTYFLSVSPNSLMMPLLPSEQNPPDPSQSALLTTLSNSPHTFLLPTSTLNASALALAKHYLDPAAQAISSISQHRIQQARKKRKRGEPDPASSLPQLQLDQLHVRDFETAQVWEQARRIVDAATIEVQLGLEIAAQDAEQMEEDVKLVEFGEDGFEVDSEEEEGEDVEDGSEDLMDEDLMEDMSDGAEELLDGDEGQGMSEGEDTSSADGQQEQSTFVADPHGLNDGFFSIDDFNRQSEFLEEQDTKGDLYDGQASDEEDIDWDADPATYTTKDSSKKKRSKLDDELSDIDEDVFGQENDEDDEDDEEEDGPTFGNADLNGVDDSDEDEELQGDMDLADMMGNTNDVYYADFFDPPARKASKSSRPPQPSRESTALMPLDQDIERTASAVRRDLFDESPEPSSSDEGDKTNNIPTSSRTPKLAQRSNHEKRQAALSAEIRKLEAAAVAKRSWALSGEALASDRPLNSLLEEDLEFERAGKPVPLSTIQDTEDLEALIKRRIADSAFDELVRRLPDSVVAEAQVQATRLRRGAFELSDAKDETSLAELYEQDHLSAQNPKSANEPDAATKKAHAEVEQLWRECAAKLDALSNAHFKPRVPKAGLTIVADVAAVSMEDAQPAAGGEAGASMLAPQEIWKPGMAEQGGKKGEGEVLLGKSGVPVRKEEMTRDEKKRRRRRAKERLRKKLGNEKAVEEAKRGHGSGRRADEARVKGELRRAKIGVIGKKGEILDVDGRAVKEMGKSKGAGAFRL